MEFLEIADILIYAVVAVVTAVVLARRGQLALLKQLFLCLSSDVDKSELYKSFPRSTKLLISGKTVDKLCTACEDNTSEQTT